MAQSYKIGDRIDEFTITGKVHSGGMARIYTVDGPGLEFPALMKTPRLGFGEPGASVVSFEVEMSLMAVLSGNHVPRFVAFGDITRTPYLVMELVEGRSLDEWIGRAPLVPGEIARLGGALATALHSIHLQDAVHLDVKPGNVIIRPDGQAVLIDFGLAHHARYPDLLAEEWRKPMGSGPYMSPEQVLGVRHDHRSDIFALGVVLYELATGKLPFGAPTTYTGLKKRLWKDPQPPRALNPAVPDWLQEIILKCLETDLDERYETAAQVAYDLAHGENVAITERGRRMRTMGLYARVMKWLAATGFESPEKNRPLTFRDTAPIVLVAVASGHENPDMDHALRRVVTHLARLDDKTRFAIVSIIPPSPEVSVEREEETATGQQIKHRVRLRNWAEPLGALADRLSFHVLEDSDPASAILNYVRVNNVAHVVIGSPPLKAAKRGRFGVTQAVVMSERAIEPAPLIQLMGTVSMRIAAAAPCTVTVVRVAGRN